MKIRKFLVLVICPVVLTLFLSPVSFAFSDIQPSVVNSSMSEPTVQRSGGSVDFYITSYISPISGYITSQYAILVYHLEGPDNAVYSYDPDWRLKWNCYSSVSGCSGVCHVFDLDGHLILERSFQLSQYNSSSDTYSEPSTPYFPNISPSSSWVINGSLPEGMFFRRERYVSAEPFVSFSQQPLEHNIYHSELSEPVADEYNSYFICNDRLYWLSYRANGLYSYNQNVEVSSVVSSESASYGSTGSGSYSGQSGGQTELVTAPYVIVSGSVSNGEVFNGSASSPNFGQIDYVGSSQGNLSFSQNGNITYNSVEVYPVSISSQLLNRLFDVVIYLSDDSGFKVWLVPRSDLGQSLILDASLYCSAFDLTNGEYLSSSFSSYTGSYQYAGFDYPLEDPVSDVRCYGCAFYNLNNIPVNLSDVLWQYDLSFVLWREDVLQKLNDIYNVLSEAESITSYQAPDLASKMDDENIINDLSYNSGDVQQNLNDNIDRGIQTLGSDGGQLQSLTSQIIGLGNGKIFSLLIISLSLGILILILGKNKND